MCGFGCSDALPPTYPHMLAFPLHLALMTDGRFPFPAIGLVHIANEIVQHRPIDARETLSLRVWATRSSPIRAGASSPSAPRRGSGDELVWEEVSTNLRRGAAARARTTRLAAGAETPPARTCP